MATARWNENTTVKFVKEYISHECLWNCKNPSYKIKDARETAYNQIMEKMGISNFGHNEIKAKIKSIRSTYAQEVKKIKSSKKSGAGTDSVYKPSVKWFTTLDDTLRDAYIEIRKTHDNMNSSETDTDMETQNTQLEEHVNQGQDRDINRPSRKRTITKNLNALLDKVQGVTAEINTGLPITDENEFRIFGRSVGAQLNALPLETALEAQPVIQSYITKLRLQHLKNKRSYSVNSDHSTIQTYITSPQYTPSPEPSTIDQQSMISVSASDENPSPLQVIGFTNHCTPTNKYYVVDGENETTQNQNILEWAVANIPK